MDFTYKVVKDFNFDPIAWGWVGDYLGTNLNLQKILISCVKFFRVFKSEIRVLSLKVSIKV